MDRTSLYRPSEYPHDRSHTAAPPSSSHVSQYPPPASQPAMQIPFGDPFSARRDPFYPHAHTRSGSQGQSTRPWPPLQASPSVPPQPIANPSATPQPAIHHHHHHPLHLHSPTRSPPPIPSSLQHPPPLPAAGMPPPPLYDSARRRSLGGAGSPPQYVGAPLEPHPQPPSYPARSMPPLSPPQNPHSSNHLAAAPRGPSTSSLFAGAHDLASHRPGMSISAILGGDDRPRSETSHHGLASSATPKPMHPPSPGRARSASMREGSAYTSRDRTPPRGSHYTSTPLARSGSDQRREEHAFGSPPFRREVASSFRAFQPSAHEQMPHMNGHQGTQARPASQPAESSNTRNVGLRSFDDIVPREAPSSDSRTAVFRHYGEPQPAPRPEPNPRHDRPHEPRLPIQNGFTSHPQERDRAQFHQASLSDRDHPQQPTSFHQMSYGPPIREEPAPLFRPAYQVTSHPTPDSPLRESIENRAPDMRRQLSRPTPPPSDHAYYDRRGGNGIMAERPLTFEEHQRLDASGHDYQRKEHELSIRRSLLTISPELSRIGRNSPLPQAVHGAQSKHVGPGGDNPGIKSEFGRMFSGLGSGVGSTPTPGQTMNGVLTPSRMSPARHVERGDLLRTAVAELDDIKPSSKTNSRSRKNGRRPRDEADRAEMDGSSAPDTVRGSKRNKVSHPTHHHHHHQHARPHHHHHHHHQHEAAGATPGSFGTMRLSSDPPSAQAPSKVSSLPQQSLQQQQSQHSHHHHHHHHHHPHVTHHSHRELSRPAAAPRKPSITINSKQVLDSCSSRPRQHLGSQLYEADASLPSSSEIAMDTRVKLSSKVKPIRAFPGKENCLLTIRVPRYYLESSDNALDGGHGLEEICRRREVWGTDVYTDDSDVVAAAVHAGWLKGDFGDFNEDIHDVFENTSEHGDEAEVEASNLSERPLRPVRIPRGHDAHVTILLLPTLEYYPAVNRHHLWSREWKNRHDGMSFMIHKIEFVVEGKESRFFERGAAARKKRIALEEIKRKEAAAGLLMFANAASDSSTVSVGA